MADPKATSQTLSDALDHPDVLIRHLALEHPNVNQDHIIKALNNPEEDIQRLAARHPKSNPYIINIALDHPNPQIRYEALNNRRATAENFRYGIKDPKQYVQDISVRRLRNPSYKEPWGRLFFE